MLNAEITILFSLVKCNVYSGLRDIYRTEMCQQQDQYAKDLERWKELERCHNLKLEEKKQECEDNITYYTQREVELEAKIDELMTRLQDQTAAYMKLQSEFDNYEWWDEDEDDMKEDGEEGHGVREDGKEAFAKKRSRESLQTRSRPPTRPPTREDTDTTRPRPPTRPSTREDTVRPPIFEPESATESVASSGNNSLDPEIPPRRTEKAPEEFRTSCTDEEHST